MSVRWRRMALAAGWGVVVGWLPLSVVYGQLLQHVGAGDFGTYYAAAELLRYTPHGALYSMPALATMVQAHGGCGPEIYSPYAYQPLLAILLEPLTYLPCPTAAVIWMLFNSCLWIGVSAAYTGAAWRDNGPYRALMTALMTMFLLPALWGIAFGQVHRVMLACIVVGIWLVHRHHEYGVASR